MKLVDGRSTRAIIGDGTAQRVICPFCEVEYVHPIGVRVYPVHGTIEVSVTHEGVETSSSDAAHHQRRVSIVLGFWCENGHEWESELQFLKGLTILETRLCGETPTDKHGMFQGPMPDTIWRD
jgi:hypothetical protein